jgi:hypothetical protein
MDLEEGWRRVETEGIKPFQRLIDDPDPQAHFFTVRGPPPFARVPGPSPTAARVQADKYVVIYDLIFKLCTRRDQNLSEVLYGKGVGGRTARRPHTLRPTQTATPTASSRTCRARSSRRSMLPRGWCGPARRRSALVSAARRRSQSEAPGQNERAFLREWTNRWRKHKLYLKGMVNLFVYLDRFFTTVRLRATQSAEACVRVCVWLTGLLAHMCACGRGAERVP